MGRNAWWCGVAVCAGLLTGCVERRFVITSDPPGAVVYRNGQPIGATPVDDHFVYYGDYEFTLVKDGYETLHVKQTIPAPWYQWVGLDFVSENLYPCKVEDVHRFHYQMCPLQAVRTDELLSQAENLRNRGRSLTTPGSVEQPPPRRRWFSWFGTKDSTAPPN